MISLKGLALTIESREVAGRLILDTLCLLVTVTSLRLSARICAGIGCGLEFG